ncbi:MAG: TetR family transcriptional regulator [Candidatus Cloacimonetes bacterium]|nr:TetR family transcriptional regulator [Candidatus Cloacimonadota bacterium]
MKKIRAISNKQKLEKKQMIINSAEFLLMDSDYRQITVDMIAKEAKIAKGTVFLYFKSKEEIFLSLTKQLTEYWYYRLKTILENELKKGEAVSIEGFVSLIVKSLDNELFLKMLSILDDTLEQNSDRELVYQYKLFLKHRLLNLGILIETIFPILACNDGMKIINNLFVCLIGSYKVSYQSGIVKEISLMSGMEIFIRDFWQIFTELAVCYLRGFLSNH